MTNKMTEKQKEAYYSAINGVELNYDMGRVIWKPQPKQALLLACPAKDRMYGGAAGGGKSDGALGDYLKNVTKYGYAHRGICFRQEVGELEELIDRAEALYRPMGAVPKGIHTKPTFTFPNGATLKFRHLERDKDVRHYQGHQYSWICFDELGNYATDYCWTYMFSRLRSPFGVHTQALATCNPGGVGHGWIRARWAMLEPYIIHHIPLQNGGTMSRCYIPSTLDDNQILMQKDKEYENALGMLPDYLYKALRMGSWDVVAGQVFSEFDTMKHVIKPFSLEPGLWFKFAAMDWGYSKPYSIGWYAVNAHGRVIRYREMYGCEPGQRNVGTKESATQVAQRAWELSVAEGVKYMVADPAVWSKTDADDLSIAEKFASAGWEMIKGNHDRLNGIAMVHDYFKQTDEDGRPMLMVFQNCYGFIETIPLLLPDPNRPEDIDSAMEDHIYDECRYALMSEFVKTPARYINRQNRSLERQNNHKQKNWDTFTGEYGN